VPSATLLKATLTGMKLKGPARERAAQLPGLREKGRIPCAMPELGCIMMRTELKGPRTWWSSGHTVIQRMVPCTLWPGLPEGAGAENGLRTRNKAGTLVAAFTLARRLEGRN